MLNFNEIGKYDHILLLWVPKKEQGLRKFQGLGLLFLQRLSWINNYISILCGEAWNVDKK